MAAARRGEGARRPPRCEAAEAEGAARMAAGAGGRNVPLCSTEQRDGMRRDGGGDPYWSR